MSYIEPSYKWKCQHACSKHVISEEASHRGSFVVVKLQLLVGSHGQHPDAAAAFGDMNGEEGNDVSWKIFIVYYF